MLHPFVVTARTCDVIITYKQPYELQGVACFVMLQLLGLLIKRF